MTEQAKIKLCAARWVWSRRKKLTPRAGITWERWFELKYGQTLADYRASDERNKIE